MGGSRGRCLADRAHQGGVCPDPAGLCAELAANSPPLAVWADPEHGVGKPTFGQPELAKGVSGPLEQTDCAQHQQACDFSGQQVGEWRGWGGAGGWQGSSGKTVSGQDGCRPEERPPLHLGNCQQELVGRVGALDAQPQCSDGADLGRPQAQRIAAPKPPGCNFLRDETDRLQRSQQSILKLEQGLVRGHLLAGCWPVCQKKLCAHQCLQRCAVAVDQRCNQATVEVGERRRRRGCRECEARVDCNAAGEQQAEQPAREPHMFEDSHLGLLEQIFIVKRLDCTARLLCNVRNKPSGRPGRSLRQQNFVFPFWRGCPLQRLNPLSKEDVEERRSVAVNLGEKRAVAGCIQQGGVSSSCILRAGDSAALVCSMSERMRASWPMATRCLR